MILVSFLFGGNPMSRICDYVTSKELAERYRVKPETVLSWARRGWIPFVRAGHRPVLFDPNEVDFVLRARGRLPEAHIKATMLADGEAGCKEGGEQ
jgi:excisionase family DNA binding protein